MNLNKVISKSEGVKMKISYILPVIFGLTVGYNCYADCNCAEELKNNPEFMNSIIQSVRQDLVKNPEILQDMSNALQQREAETKNKELREYVNSNMDSMMADAPILGNVDADKTIFVWTDFSCPFCRRVHGELDKVLKERSDVRVVIKNFSIHGDLSDAPARAVIAAKLQDNSKAAALVESLMTKEYYSQEDTQDSSKLAEKVKENVLNFARDAGLDTDKLSADMQGDIASREMSNVRDLANRFEIHGTPFLIINNKAFPGAIPYDQIINALNN